jgi:hypothetical protein
MITQGALARRRRTSTDMQTPDQAATSPAASSRPSHNFVEHLLDMLAATAPGASDDNTAGRARSREDARELFDALNPRDAAEAQLAAIAVAAAQSAMDNFVRAARPGVSAETAVRLRSNGLAAGRTYAAALRTLRQPPPDATRTKPAAAHPPTPDPKPDAPSGAPAQATTKVPPGLIALQPGAKPIPAVETFQPRDRFGLPIPDWRTDLMTRAQVRASLAIPRDPVLEAEAIAEEEAMIAQQAALDARGGAKDTGGGSAG